MSSKFARFVVLVLVLVPVLVPVLVLVLVIVIVIVIVIEHSNSRTTTMRARPFERIGIHDTSVDNGGS
ncbi:MAG: membrane or secreted protein [Candidatus Hydrogenedentes bacterium]|nr:membrane or secreted protein [Candidatus Hydrogenedentota bacterium]